MRTATGTLILLLAGAGAVFSSVPPQAAQVRSIEILIQRPDRTFVTTVGPADLRVTIGGTSVAMDRVERVDGPLSVLLLVDLSLSATARTHGILPNPADPLGMVAALDREFAKRLPPADRARVGWFAGSTVLFDHAFRSDRLALATAVTDLLVRRFPSRTEAFGPSPMVDAVSSVVGLLTNETGRRAILLISDGESSGNRLSLEDAARRATAARVAVHAMLDAPAIKEGNSGFTGTTGDWYPKNHDRGCRLLSKLAALTGGAYSRDERFAKASWGFSMPMPPFDYFFTAMHSGLRVTFSDATVSPGASIEITAKDPKWVVSAPRWLPDEP